MYKWSVAISVKPKALNDFTILKRDTSSMVIIHTYVNGEFLNSKYLKAANA